PACSRLCTRLRCGTSASYWPHTAHTGSCGPWVGGSESQLGGSGSFAAGWVAPLSVPKSCTLPSAAFAPLAKAAALAPPPPRHLPRPEKPPPPPATPAPPPTTPPPITHGERPPPVTVPPELPEREPPPPPDGLPLPLAPTL